MSNYIRLYKKRRHEAAPFLSGILNFSALRRGGRRGVFLARLPDEERVEQYAAGSDRCDKRVRVEPHASEHEIDQAFPRLEQTVLIALYRKGEAEAGADAGEDAVEVAADRAL